MLYRPGDSSKTKHYASKDAYEEHYRDLAAAILQTAYQDYANPNYAGKGWITRGFLHTSWCESLCELVGIPYEEYKRRMIKLSKLEKPKPKGEN